MFTGRLVKMKNRGQILFCHSEPCNFCLTVICSREWKNHKYDTLYIEDYSPMLSIFEVYFFLNFHPIFHHIYVGLNWGLRQNHAIGENVIGNFNKDIFYS